MSDEMSIPSPAAYRPPTRPRGLSPDTKRRIMIAGGLAGALVVVGGIVALISRSGGEVPVIQADDRPIRVKPENPGGMQIAGVNNEIFGDTDTSSGARLAPAAEAPNPAALRAPPQPEPRPALRADVIEPAAKVVPAAPTGAKPVAREVPKTTPAAGAPATQTPAAQTLAGPQASATQAPRTATQEPVKPAQAAPPAAATAPDKRPANARIAVQLAAVQSEGAAQAEWRSLQRRLPDLLGARQPAFPKTERDGKTFWRVRTAGFADVAEARGFCERVRAKGAACSVAEF